MKRYLIVFLMLSGASAIAATNKWIDENGEIHYSDQPPPAGVEATTVHKAPPPASAPAPAKSFAERDAELKKARQSKAEAAERAAQQQSNAEIEKANCSAAKQTLQSLQQSGRVVMYGEQGERRYLEDAERQQRTAEAQQGIEKWCK